MAYLNILDFGAKGDGKTNDTKALILAMEQAEKTEGIVYFPKGNYLVDPVKIPSHITLLGGSSWGYNQNSKEEGRSDDEGFEGNALLTAASANGIALLDLTGCRGTRIIGLSLNGGGLGKCLHGVYSRHCGVEQNNCYEDCRISNFTGSGLKMDWVWVFAIRRCLIINNGLYGIDIDRGYDGWVIDNQISANGKAGILAGPGMVCYTANRIEWNKEGGIFCDDTQNVNITGNCFDHNFGPAIWFKNSRASAVTGNISKNDGFSRTDDKSCAFLLENSSGLSITGNSVWGCPMRDEAGMKNHDSPYYGMLVRGLTDCIVADNALFEAATKEVIRDEGGHCRAVINNNTGSLFKKQA